jgi:hypothetical protein
MLEVLIERIEYIVGIPIELTERAVEASAIRKGEIVGLLVSTMGSSPQQLRIELKLRESGQERLIKAGQRIPVSEKIDGTYVLYGDWRYYA